VKMHPLFDDPNAVLVSRTPVSDPVCPDDYRRAAWQVMAALQIELQGEKAVIKPNVTAGESFADPDTGITTHPAFVEVMIDYLAAHGARRGSAYILEDPRNSNDNEPRHWRGTGYGEVAARTGARLRVPKTYTCVKKAVPQPLVHPVLNVSRLAVAPNTVLLNVPKLKTHNLGITTLSLKNLMGTVNVFDRHYCAQAWQDMPAAIRADSRPREEWMDRSLHERLQEGLARRLVDTAQVVRPRLNVVEGVVAREGTGFQRGRNHPLGLAIAGSNVVAVDSVASYLIGFDPQALVYLRVAAEAGLGTNDLDLLRVYVVEGTSVVPCPDLDALCARPPLRVLSGIMGEDRDLFT
jgi:uncharacterized protein (DUF362 family)